LKEKGEAAAEAAGEVEGELQRFVQRLPRWWAWKREVWEG
jgi:hypothetical protein